MMAVEINAEMLVENSTLSFGSKANVCVCVL